MSEGFIPAVVESVRSLLPAWRRIDRKHVTLNRIALHLLLILSLFVLFVPLLIALIASTQEAALMTSFRDLVPGRAAARNYWIAFVELGFWRYMFNSFVMAIVIVLGQLVLGLLAALAIVYYDFPFADLIFVLILLTLLLPVPVRFVPLYELVVAIGWLDTMLAITVPYLASAVAVFILREHFRTIPQAQVDLAKIDGVGPIKFLVNVLIPMSKEILAALSVIIFIYAWNQYLWPVVVIDSEEKQVVQVGLGALGGDAITMAGVIMALLPPLILLILLHRTLLDTVNLTVTYE